MLLPSEEEMLAKSKLQGWLLCDVVTWDLGRSELATWLQLDARCHAVDSAPSTTSVHGLH